MTSEALRLLKQNQLGLTGQTTSSIGLTLLSPLTLCGTEPQHEVSNRRRGRGVGDIWGYCATCARWFYCAGWFDKTRPQPVCPVCSAEPVAIENRSPRDTAA